VLKLQTGNADATKLANAIAIKQDGATVGLTLSVPSSELSADLTDMVKEGQKKEEQKKAEKHAQNANPPSENK
jgi:hypothetical protein